MSAPRKTKQSMTGQHYQQEIENLKQKLNEARRMMINLLPREVAIISRNFLRDFTINKNDMAFDDLVDKLIEHAKLSAFPGAGYITDEIRAYCPLCGSGCQGPYDKGFRLPGGMQRHFFGHGNLTQCGTMAVLITMAHDLRRELQAGNSIGLLLY